MSHLSGCHSISLRFLKDLPRRALHLSAARPDLAHLHVKGTRCTSRCEGGRLRSPEGKKASVNGGGEELKLMKSRGTWQLVVFCPSPRTLLFVPAPPTCCEMSCWVTTPVALDPKSLYSHILFPSIRGVTLDFGFLQTQSQFALCRARSHMTLAEPIPVHPDVSCKKKKKS